MAVNTTLLLAGLEDYHKCLTRHVIQMEQEYQNLERGWRAFSNVYEGAAAEQFRTGWGRTVTGFRTYVEQSQHIMKILEERITALREANRTEGYL